MEGKKISIFAIAIFLILFCTCTLTDATITDFFCRSTTSEPLINATTETARFRYRDLLLSHLWRLIQPQRSFYISKALSPSKIPLAILYGNCIGTPLSNDLIITTAKCAIKYTKQHNIQHFSQRQASLHTVHIQRDDTLSRNSESTSRTVDSVHIHPHGVDIAYIRLRQQHVDVKQADSQTKKNQLGSKSTYISPIGVMVNTNNKIPRPNGMARAFLMDNTALRTTSNNGQTVVGTIHSSDFPVVPTSQCLLDHSKNTDNDGTYDKYMCRLNQDVHSHCELQLRYDN